MRHSRPALQPRPVAAILTAALSLLVLLVPAATGDTGAAAATPAAGYTASLIPTGLLVSSWVAVDPATETVYFASQSNHEIVVLDTATNGVTSTIPLSGAARSIAVDAATDTVYVAINAASTTSAPVLDVIDGTTNTVTTTITLPVGSLPAGVAVDSSTDTVYVTEEGAAAVAVIDGSTDLITTTISTGSGTHPLSLAVDETLDVIWVGTSGGEALAINGASNSVENTISLGSGVVTTLAVSPATNTVYASILTGGIVGVIDESTDTLKTQITGMQSLDSVAVDPGSGTVFASSTAGGGGSGTTWVIDAATNAITDTIERGGLQNAVDTATGSVYIAPSGDQQNAVWVLTPSTANAMSPVIKNASATLSVGSAFSGTLPGTALPAATYSESGPLPSGVTLSSSGVLSGTPAAGTGGTYPITVTAGNGVPPDYTLAGTIIVDAAPSITSANEVVFDVGAPGSFAVSAFGSPAPTFTESGALPAGVTFSSAGVLSGTPANGSGGPYPIQITASNSQGTATQAFTLIVDVPGAPLPAGGVLGDVNGDGLADILAFDPSGNLWLYPNTGSGGPDMFGGARSRVGAGWSGYKLGAVADLYGSGRAGILAIDPSGNLWYYPNTGGSGTSTFGARSQVGSGWRGYTVVGLTALYGPGRPGILAIDPSGRLWYYPNVGGRGTSTFGARSLVGVGWIGYTADVADINGDGKPDLLAVDTAGDMWVYPNTGGTGTNTFTGSYQIGAGWSGYQAIDAGLLTGPGRASIVGVDPAGNLWYYPNSGPVFTPFGVPVLVGSGWTGFTIN